MMSNFIKDLSVSSSSLIGFEVEWHSSRFDKGNVENRGMKIVVNSVEDFLNFNMMLSS